jgi:large subunit ribosomal protein L18
VRKKVRGTPDRPRLSVHRSLQHIACQLIDDVAGKTLVAASSRDPSVREQLKYGGNKPALAAGIKSVRFDRGHSRYHGRVAALADAAREAGLVF